MHAPLTTDEPFNGEDNWYFSFKNCTTPYPRNSNEQIITLSNSGDYFDLIIARWMHHYSPILKIFSPKIHLISPIPTQKNIFSTQQKFAIQKFSQTRKKKFSSNFLLILKKRVDESWELSTG